MKSEPEVARLMNSIPKIVFSKTLKPVKDGPVWKNVRILNKIERGEIVKMKEQQGGDIAIFGSGTITQQLTDLGLIDEYRLIVNPVILGSGKPLFGGVKGSHGLRLQSTKLFKNGNVLLCYEPARN